MSEQNEHTLPEADQLVKPSEDEPISEAEKAQLETANKIGRGLADKLNNDLAVTGVLDMVIEDPSLSPNHRALLEEVMGGMMRAGQRSSELMRMKRFRETTSPGGQPMLDWDKSLPQNPPKPNTPPKR